MARNCKVDDKRLAPLKECTQTYDSLEGEWTHNYLSVKTVVYSCGRPARAGEAVAHDHDPAELALCKRLSKEAAKIMSRTNLCMGDESDHEFAPFFITANAGDKSPAKLTEARLRRAFGGTIWPGCTITIAPLKAKGAWWEAATGQHVENKDEKALSAWRSLVAWFNGQPELHGACFVRIDDRSPEPMGCVFPRLVLALTGQGSLVGLFGCVVHT